MTTVPKPPKAVGKGTPPTTAKAPHVVSNNTTKPAADKPVTMNLLVQESYRQKVKQFALDHKMSVKDVMTNAIDEYMARHGAAK